MTTRLLKSSENINRLPIGFQEVEYLESSGTQYIDTGLTGNNNTKIDVLFSKKEEEHTMVVIGRDSTGIYIAENGRKSRKNASYA